ncbi:MAG TPA: antitoxin Xre/MbcA/ParS toxin-binding domain-containing protein [Mucilaginibacter sp.]|jgi:putative toxin-antitoxin system antitoxin component (TIGR02293 family)
MEAVKLAPKIGSRLVSDYKELTDKLGGKHLLGQEINSDYDLFDIIEQGLTKKVFLHAKSFIGLNLATITSICGITSRTVQIKEDDAHFDHKVSETLVDLVDLFIIGIKVFSENKKFIQWMLHPLRTLEGKEPISLIQNSVGRTMVKEELIMLATGVYR